MKKVAVIACGAYADSGYGCPGEWRCFKAASLGEGSFTEPCQVVSYVKCVCPGRSTVSNVGMAIKLSGLKPDAVYLSSCLVSAKPGCPYQSPEDLKKMLETKFDVPVILGTHDYS